ncbi:hypothetical protein [Streptomyces sp. NPDC004376]
MPGRCRGDGGRREVLPPSAAAGTGVLRPLRAAVAAALCVTATALGHTLMSGDRPPAWALALGFTATAAGAWWLTGRERGAATVVGATTVVQGALHLLFDLAHALVREPGQARGLPRSGAVGHMSHSMPGMEMYGGTADAPTALSLRSAPALSGTVGMVLAHLLAAVVCGLWLWRGETAAHRLTRAFAVALLAPLRRVIRLLARSVCDGWTVPGGPVDGRAEARRTTSTVLRHAVVRRGPPGTAGPALSRRFAERLPAPGP